MSRRSTAAAALAAAIAGAALAGIGLGPAAAQTDRQVVVSNLNDSGPGSLRAAIASANSSRGTRIEFAVSGTIALGTALPAITRRTTIDGTTAPGYAAGGAPVIALDNGARRGLRFAAGAAGSQLLGVSVVDARGPGVTLDADGITLNANYVGLNPDGAAQGNRGPGVLVSRGSSGNRIGLNPTGCSGVVGNVISGNAGHGIVMRGATRNTVVANRIGTDPTGTAPVPNRGHGLWLTNGADGNTIGGTDFVDACTGLTNDPTGSKGSVTPVFVVPPLGNLISGNRGDGVLISRRSERNVLSGNFVGTRASGDGALANAGAGVRIAWSDRNRLIGCRFQDEPFVYYNVVSGNGRSGLHIRNSDDVVVHANFLGVGADNTTLIPNAGDGILVDGDSEGTQVGGVIPLGNVAAGNRRNGIAVRDTARGFITFNTFGGLLAFKGAAPNGGSGLLVTSTGGDNLARTNVFSGNAGNGVTITGAARGVTLDPNIVGATTNGMSPLPNGRNGVEVSGTAHDNVIGGNRRSVIPQNTFSGNTGHGLVIRGRAHDNRVINSYVGTKIFGREALPNGRGGILIADRARDNVIGVAGVRPANLVSGNAGNGVTLGPRTARNRFVNDFVGLARDGAQLPNSGLAILDEGRGNVFERAAVR